MYRTARHGSVLQCKAAYRFVSLKASTPEGVVVVGAQSMAVHRFGAHGVGARRGGLKASAPFGAVVVATHGYAAECAGRQGIGQHG